MRNYWWCLSCWHGYHWCFCTGACSGVELVFTQQHLKYRFHCSRKQLSWDSRFVFQHVTSSSGILRHIADAKVAYAPVHDIFTIAELKHRSLQPLQILLMPTLHGIDASRRELLNTASPVSLQPSVSDAICGHLPPPLPPKVNGVRPRPSQCRATNLYNKTQHGGKGGVVMRNAVFWEGLAVPAQNTSADKKNNEPIFFCLQSVQNRDDQ